MFADDRLLYKTIGLSQAVNLQQDLLAMQTWADTWLIKFNISMFCNEGHPIYIGNIKFYMTTTLMIPLQVFRNQLQSNVRWSKHIEEFTVKASSTLGIMRHNIGTDQNLNIPSPYQTQLEYASSAWLSQDILGIEKVQHCVAHFVHNHY